MKRPIAVCCVALALIAVAPPSPARVPGRAVAVVVAFHPETTEAQRAAARAVTGGVLTGRAPGLDLERWVVPPEGSGTIDAPGVRWVEPDRTLHVFERPNDVLLGRQWAYDLLGFGRAWKIETGARSPVVVGVVDTGADATHPEMEGRLVPGHDFLENDGAPDDDYGHGTGVAAIVAANTDNRAGIAGMSWGAKIMPLRTCDANGGCSMFSVAQAIAFAAAKGVQVVNLSLGGAMPSCSRTLQAAAAFAAHQGSLLVAASGNSAQSGNPTNYPAACEGFMAVGATNALDGWAPFSDFGPHLSVSAPGAAVTTAWIPEESPAATRGYITADGTSFAAPHVAGLAALLWSKHPEWTPQQVRDRIEQTAVDLGPKGHDPYFGHGRIDVVKALRR